jgi:hypothetical protein
LGIEAWRSLRAARCRLEDAVAHRREYNLEQPQLTAVNSSVFSAIAKGKRVASPFVFFRVAGVLGLKIAKRSARCASAKIKPSFSVSSSPDRRGTHLIADSAAGDVPGHELRSGLVFPGPAAWCSTVKVAW